jgi:hypothetical protein
MFEMGKKKLPNVVLILSPEDEAFWHRLTDLYSYVSITKLFFSSQEMALAEYYVERIRDFIHLEEEEQIGVLKETTTKTR